MRLRKAVEDSEEVRYNALELMQALRNKIESGELRRGTYMPTVRRLGKSHQVSPNTALRALRILAEQGLIEARPRRGFWICDSKPAAASFAYLMATENIYAGFDALYKTLMHEFHSCAGANREHVTAIVLNPGDETHIIRQHNLSQLTGLILDKPNETLFECAKKFNIAVVLIDDEDPRRRVNAVVQDGFAGGGLAAKHVLASGCQRIAWFGKALDHYHSRARYGGAMAAMTENGRVFTEQRFLPLDSRQDESSLHRVALEMLAKRPDGVLALWPPFVAAIASAARELGLKAGSDFQLVGWTPAELYESTYAPLFDGKAPPAVVWNARKMAETALGFLRMPPVHACGEAVVANVPVALKV